MTLCPSVNRGDEIGKGHDDDAHVLVVCGTPPIISPTFLYHHLSCRRLRFTTFPYLNRRDCSNIIVRWDGSTTSQKSPNQPAPIPASPGRDHPRVPRPAITGEEDGPRPIGGPMQPRRGRSRGHHRPARAGRDRRAPRAVPRIPILWSHTGDGHLPSGRRRRPVSRGRDRSRPRGASREAAGAASPASLVVPSRNRSGALGRRNPKRRESQGRDRSHPRGASREAAVAASPERLVVTIRQSRGVRPNLTGDGPPSHPGRVARGRRVPRAPRVPSQANGST